MVGCCELLEPILTRLFCLSDVPLAEFLRELNNTQSFIIVDIDDTHLLVKNTADTLKFLKVKIEEWQDGNTYVRALFSASRGRR